MNAPVRFWDESGKALKDENGVWLGTYIGHAPYAPDWEVTRMHADGAMHVIEGINLNRPEGDPDRRFLWTFTWYPGVHVLPWRYDFTNAEITPEALAYMEQLGMSQEVR